MAKEFKMSQARYDELKQELDYSKTTRADEVAELIKEARGFGDLVGSQEADVMSRAISEDSPFGKALMGRKAGDEVTVEAPKGVIHYRIDTIER